MVKLSWQLSQVLLQCGNNLITWRRFRVWMDKIHGLLTKARKMEQLCTATCRARNPSVQSVMTRTINLWRPIQGPQDVRARSWASHSLYTDTPPPCPCISVTHGNYFLSPGSHTFALLCSLRSRWFQQKFHQKSRPAHTSHGRRWTALAPPGHWAQQRPSAVAPAGVRPAAAHTPAHAPRALSPPLFTPQRRPAGTGSHQCNATSSHNNPFCSYAHPIDSTKRWGENSCGPHGVPS